MKRLVLLAVLAAAFCGQGATSTGATTNWVAKYVADYVTKAISNSTSQIAANAQVADSNAVSRTTMVANGVEFEIIYEQSTVAAVVAQNCTVQSGGVTNGVMWAWDGQDNRYRNKDFAPVIPTQTNMTFGVNSSREIGGRTWMCTPTGTQMFELRLAQIQESTAKKVKGEE